MKRSELKRKTPMQRTGILRTASFSSAKPERKRMKSTRPKMTPIRKSARGEDCTLLIPGVCTNDTATVVLCHSNRLGDGKGMGLKAPDEKAAYGCHCCHEVLDGRKPRPAGMSLETIEGLFDRAVNLTHARLREKGLL